MNSVIGKLAEIETTAETIVEHARQQKTAREEPDSRQRHPKKKIRYMQVTVTALLRVADLHM